MYFVWFSLNSHFPQNSNMNRIVFVSWTQIAWLWVMADLLFTHKCNSSFLWLPVLSRRTLLLFFKSWAVTSTASSEWQQNTMTWRPNKRRHPGTVLSEYGTLPADTDVLYTFPLLCVIRQVEIYRTWPAQHSDTTSDVLATPAYTANKTSLARTCEPPERSHEQRTTVLKSWKCEEAQRQSYNKDCSCVNRKDAM